MSSTQSSSQYFSERQKSLIQTLAERRGLDPSDESFFSFNYENLYDPDLMPGMQNATARIYQAIKENQKIVVYADYDCDGIPGAVIFSDFFKKLDYKNFEIYIPDRHTEGYGLHIAAVQKLAEEGTNLIITIDLGITANAEIKLANELGVDVIVTDHHIPHQILPEAFAIINPKCLGPAGEQYPDPMLCGAATAFKLIQGFLKRYGEEFGVSLSWSKWLLDMVGVATLSDMVPLLNENRLLAFYGLLVLRKTRRPGLLSIFKKMNIDLRTITEDDVVFMLTPRLNAASRMDSPRRAFELLIAEDEATAIALADHLIKINDTRKKIVATIMKDVRKTLEARDLSEIIVVGHPDWRIGILGLVAGKIMDIYKRPVFVWGKEGGETIKGSCRSEGSVNVVDLMSCVPEGVFSNWGGHELAGGFTVLPEAIHHLEETLLEALLKTDDSDKKTSLESTKDEQIKEQIKKDVLELFDASLSLNDVSIDTYQVVDMFAPFGASNPKPVFLIEDATIQSSKKFGKEKNHLELIFNDERGRAIKAICFFAEEGNFTRAPVVGEAVSLLATLEVSYFARRQELRLRIIDIK